VADIVLTTLNAKYAHAAFGLRYLMANLGELVSRAAMLEFDIAARPVDVIEAILAQHPKIVGVGVYIWNVAPATQLVAELKRIAPQLTIILGGPEVSYETDQQEICRAIYEGLFQPQWVKQIDKQRIDYLFPNEVDEQASQRRYMAEFEDLIQFMKSQNIRVIVIKPPIPQRVYRMMPNQEHFDTTLKEMSERRGIEFYDFSQVNNDEKFFFNTDHLNRTGVLNFFQNYLASKLVSDPPHN